MMVALLLYAYSQGIYSSRRIAKACEERLDFAAVTGGDAAARLPHHQRLPQAAPSGTLGIVPTGVEAVPGGGSGEARSRRLGRHQDQGERLQAQGDELRADEEAAPALAAEVQRWLAAAAETDEAEDRVHGIERRGDEMPEWMANKQRRLEKIRTAKAALEAEARAAEADQASEKGDGSGTIEKASELNSDRLDWRVDEWRA